VKARRGQPDSGWFLTFTPYQTTKIKSMGKYKKIYIKIYFDVDEPHL
jgi:hypothetical protein